MSESNLSNSEWGEQYQLHVRWLKEAHFQRDLARDNIDDDVIEEELSTLRHVDQPLTGRQKVVKFLRSHPVQTVLFAFVLLDACIVIAQILLDINSLRARLHQRNGQWIQVLEFLRLNQPDARHHDPSNLVRLIRKLFDNYLVSTTNLTHTLLSTTTTATTTTTTNTFSVPSSVRAVSDLRGQADGRLESIDIKAAERASVSLQGSDEGVGGLAASRAQEVEAGDEQYDAGTSRDPFSEAACVLHYVSIVILGFLIIEDLVRISAMGRSICRHKIEILDTLVIGASFGLDVLFLGGVSGEVGQKVAAALFLLLIWRMARVVDGIIIAVKRRHEFRIRLQRRARRNAERKLEAAEEERLEHSREMEALQQLCVRGGVKQVDIAAVCNKSPTKRHSRMLHALSSVARLSVGMTLSPSFSLLPRYASESCLVSPLQRGPLTGPFSPRGGRSGSPAHNPPMDRRATYPQPFDFGSGRICTTGGEIYLSCHPEHAKHKGGVSRGLSAGVCKGAANGGARIEAELGMMNLSSRVSRSMEDISVFTEPRKFIFEPVMEPGLSRDRATEIALEFVQVASCNGQGGKL